MTYQLREHISFCRFDDGIVIADLQRDRYLLLTGPSVERFEAIAVSRFDDEETRSFADKLIDKGILSIGPAKICAVSERAPSRGTEIAASSWKVGLTISAMFALGICRRRLRRDPLHTILVAAAAERGGRDRDRHVTGSQIDRIDAAFRAASLFRSQNDRCLSRSIALFRTLVRIGAHPEIVMGVALRPFAAHAWVELDGRLVGDDLDRVRTFKPIVRI